MRNIHHRLPTPAAMVFATLVFFVAGCVSTTAPQTVQITDGDTVVLGKTTYRLWGMDAPELAQVCTRKNGKLWACGKTAQRELSALIADNPVQCHPIATDVYHRKIAKCYAGGTDLAGAMIESGHAVALATAYQKHESTARNAKRGIWQGKFTTPRDWRANHPKAELRDE